MQDTLLLWNLPGVRATRLEVEPLQDNTLRLRPRGQTACRALVLSDPLSVVLGKFTAVVDANVDSRVIGRNSDGQLCLSIKPMATPELTTHAAELHHFTHFILFRGALA